MYSSTYILFIVHALSVFLSVFTSVSYAHPTPPSSSTSSNDGVLTHLEPWMGKLYSSSSNLDAEDKKAFAKSLQGVELGTQLDDNKGIYELKAYKSHHPANGVVAKFLPEPIDGTILGEVKALHDVGYLIDSGMLMHKNKPTPAILMKKIPGVIPEQTSVWQKGSPAQQLALANHLKSKVKEEVVKWAVHKQLLVGDFHLRNIHVVMDGDSVVKSAHVLDFGWPGVYTVQKGVDSKKVEAWFEMRWNELLRLFL
ncbi:hypothetical protein BDP27DRAFT_1423961 [Rhodocollybia butyracea]|uniref:Aminoglycoside phosphotransferase domain-containing protein n=1 Tax=Rhodocollybia butyracea TaxID=206335 RepID=A0A9P5PQU2_9AGAR|nr:hypothetical protein BDP27DRAFT_1423961 [Rhodocollybia butyracea]